MGVLDDVYGGEFLKASSLEADIDLTIVGWEVHQFDDGARQVVLSFQENDRKLGLNKTNANMIADLLQSDDPDSWKGRSITIGKDKTTFGGKIVDCIRVRGTLPGNGKAPAKWNKAAAWREWKEVWKDHSVPTEPFKKAFDACGKSEADMTEGDWKQLAAAAGPALDSDIPF